MTITSSQHRCANCDYWKGNRETKNFGRQVDVDPNDKGSCNKPGSGSRLLENKQAQWTCNDWELWGACQ